MKSTVFYSWQSDRPKNVNKDFIEIALTKAANNIASDDSINVIPAIDRDTLDLPGSPEIANAIFEKITNCGIFVGDVTTVARGENGRDAPNPNVLIELGYAAARLGWDRVICVMNEDFGGPSKLPFDLKHRRWPIRYRLASTASDPNREQVSNQLVENVELAFRTIIQSGILRNEVNPKDRRVAVKFQAAMSIAVGTFADFLRTNGYEPAMTIVGTDFADEVGTTYPNATLIDPIIGELKNVTLKSPSTTFLGDKQLPWYAVLVESLLETSDECNRILDQYADRDDRLIALVDDVANRSQFLAEILSTCMKTHLNDLYDHGIPDVHEEIFRFLLLAILKSYRVTREFI